MAARQKVEPECLAKVKEWRDEADEQSIEMEEIFREVIVLDDDDTSDDDTSSDEDSYSPRDREPSMEIVSNRATAQDLQPGDYVHYARMQGDGTRRFSRRTIFLQPHPPPVTRGPHMPNQAVFSRNPPPGYSMEGMHHTHSIPTDRYVTTTNGFFRLLLTVIVERGHLCLPLSPGANSLF